MSVNRHADIHPREHIGVSIIDLPTFGLRLAHARKTLRKLTQKELAKAAGIKQPSLSELESGETKEVSGPVLIAIAQALRVRAEWLMTGVEPIEIDPAGWLLTTDERELLDLYRNATARWKIAIKYMAKLRADERQEEAVAYVLSMVSATPVPDEKLGDNWTRPDKKT